MSRSCERTLSAIVPCVDGLLDETAKAKLNQHVGECPECARALEFQQHLHTTLGADSRREPPPLYFEGVLADIHRAMPISRKRMIRPSREIRPTGWAHLIAGTLAAIWLFMAVNVATGHLNLTRTASSKSHRLTSDLLVSARVSGPGLRYSSKLGIISKESVLLEYPDEFLREIGMLAQFDSQSNARKNEIKAG